MSGFNTKERNNNGEFEITFYTENQQDFKKVQDLCRELIGHGTPVSNEGDLISRSELKKAIEELEITEELVDYDCDDVSTTGVSQYLDRPDVLVLIDNTPAVELTEEQAIDKLHETGWLIRHDKEMTERPQGEWKRHDEWRSGEYIGGFYHVNCPCEDGYYSKWETNFCPNCGLPMKKGGAE